MNRRETGAAYEKQAEEFLKKRGLKTVVSNFRCRYGEIDLIAKEGKTTVFIEVKYRRSPEKGSPQEAVNYRKQWRICRVSDYYRMLHGLGDFAPVRFDVVAICGEKTEWLRNAFEYIPVKP